MTNFTVGPLPDFSAAPRVSEMDFGPDAASTVDNELPTETPKVNQKNPPRGARKVLGSLGTNAKTRGPGVARKLNDDDHERCVALYIQLSAIARPFHPRLSAGLADGATGCVDAWFQLAEKNANVRARICAIVEGGDWGKVFLAHAPIFMAVLPEGVLERLLMRGMGMWQNANLADENDAMVTDIFGGHSR